MIDLWATTVLTDLVPRLGAVSLADLDWLTTPEISAYLDEAAARLSELGLFVVLNTQPVASGTAAYAMNPDWLDSIHAAVSGFQMRPASTAELEALDPAWPFTECEANATPARYTMDAAQLGTLTTYPIPAQAGTLQTIDRSLSNYRGIGTANPLPSVLGDYFLYFAIWRARSKESPYQSPEMAEAAQSEVAAIEELIALYWGTPE